jgi:hypothetical protein
LLLLLSVSSLLLLLWLGDGASVVDFAGVCVSVGVDLGEVFVDVPASVDSWVLA